ncbi:hypothetical protein SDC9_56763 [bioreactor metagenome]|uniref:DNA/pantothenate metabolism flavoprotein C-terminal domain-containing protein n=1 Tax=bioreactor metagenome TaxID=1076179 RepID=A0A644X3G2_9ZZZZ
MTTHIIITAGGTSEPIDAVRRISNTSTGSLCACIYDALADNIGARAESGEKIPPFQVHYVVSASAVRPQPRENLPVSFYPVTSVASVETALEDIMAKHRISYFIHGMAVSDFTKGYLIGRDTLADELAAAAFGAICCGHADRESIRAAISRVLEHPERSMDSKTKVSSQSELMLSLVRTQKIIGKIKRWDPSVFLVGFKLLKNVTEEELVSVASELAAKNRCDLVLANDAARISKDRHFGLLVKGGRVVGRYATKREIACGIAGQITTSALQGKEGKTI